MNTGSLYICLALVPCLWVSASDNGGYYTCNDDILASENKCIFEFTTDVPDTWVELTTHDVDRTVGDSFYRGVQSYNGDMLSVSPKPWVNGDKLVGTAPDMVTGDDWNSYALLFELMAPLRDMMMFDPDALDDVTWAKWTRALTDCNAKTEDYVAERSGGTPWSTDQMYAYINNPDYKDIHHYILQYLEEGTMDLVCLSSPDLVMDHCDTIRATAGATEGVDRCNCWFDAYNAIYGECPVIDMSFTTCSGTVAPIDCANVEPVDNSSAADDGTDEGTDGGETGTPGEPGGNPAGPTPASRR